MASIFVVKSTHNSGIGPIYGELFTSIDGAKKQALSRLYSGDCKDTYILEYDSDKFDINHNGLLRCIRSYHVQAEVKLVLNYELNE